MRINRVVPVLFAAFALAACGGSSSTPIPDAHPIDTGADANTNSTADANNSSTADAATSTGVTGQYNGTSCAAQTAAATCSRRATTPAWSSAMVRRPVCAPASA